jgi:hypothetical protein
VRFINRKKLTAPKTKQSDAKHDLKSSTRIFEFSAVCSSREEKFKSSRYKTRASREDQRESDVLY